MCRPARLTALAPVLVGLLSVACSDAEAPVAAGAPLGRSAPRSDDPEVAAAREALDSGRVELARVLVGRLAEAGGSAGRAAVETRLLEARLAALEGDDVAASRRVEEARALDGADPRVYATAAELHALAGRRATAEAELARGLEACGATPELLRARGIVSICTPGGAEHGLAQLEAALAADPGLPFVERVLGQAHLLVAKARAGRGSRVEALEHALAAHEADPDDVDTRRFLAECLMAEGDLGAAVAIYEALLAEGEPLEAELASLEKNAGLAALIQGERAAAVRFFRRARELGLDDEALGTGAHVLADEARLRLERARERTGAGDLEGAETLVREALEIDVTNASARRELAAVLVERGAGELESGGWEAAEAHLREALAEDPADLVARHFLATALFRGERFAEAAEEWTRVVDGARAEGLELPEPVHLELARAQLRDGRRDAACETLEAYLVLEPAGAWTHETRAWLESLGE